MKTLMRAAALGLVDFLGGAGGPGADRVVDDDDDPTDDPTGHLRGALATRFLGDAAPHPAYAWANASVPFSGNRSVPSLTVGAKADPGEKRDQRDVLACFGVHRIARGADDDVTQFVGSRQLGCNGRSGQTADRLLCGSAAARSVPAIRDAALTCGTVMEDEAMDADNECALNYRGLRFMIAQFNHPSQNAQESRMSKQTIHTDNAPKAIGTYSQAVRCGDTVYLAGQIGLDPGRLA